jgi:hypothetical protein
VWSQSDVFWVQSRRFGRHPTTSGIPRLADIRTAGRHVRLVPMADIEPFNDARRSCRAIYIPFGVQAISNLAVSRRGFAVSARALSGSTKTTPWGSFIV